ncbi:MAG: DUF4397 domain-containing protein [Ignavibacteriae bacterium]|nr:DUF4397 domain-containing protein [Ignavibacteriota bacterium]NOG99210.1 DUF4397 domain-containing protein [Ignavibacteriota bacterium]
MNKLSKLFALLFLSLFIVVSCSDDEETPIQPTPTPEESSVRVIHASYDAPAVDIWVDGAVAISNLSYGESSGYAVLPSGTRNIKVSPTGASSPIVIDVDLTIDANSEYTVLATDQLSNITPIVAVDQRAINTSKAKIRFIHASPDAPAVDIKVEDGMGAALFGNVSFQDVKDYIEVDAGTYNLAVTPAGSTQEVVILGNVPLTSGLVYTVLARGTLDASDSVPFEVRTFVDNEAGNAFVDLMAATTNVKVVHASPDAPAVDLLVNDAIAGSGLAFPNNTGYLNITAGTKNVKVNVAGTSTTVINADVLFNAYNNYSVYAVDAAANIAPLVIEDDLTVPASGKAHVRFIHLSPDAPAVDITLTDGTIIFGNNSFKDFTAFTPLDAGSYDLQVRVAGTSTVALELGTITVTEGNIYTVFAKGFLNGTGDQALGAEIIVNNQLL